MRQTKLQQQSEIWQHNSTVLKEEYNPELIKTFEEIIEMFNTAEQDIHTSFSNNILLKAQRISEVMTIINAEIKQWQFHQKKCEKLYTLILHKKMQLQSVEMTRYELRKAKTQAIHWINDLKKSLIAIPKHSQIVKEQIRNMMMAFGASNTSNDINYQKTEIQLNCSPPLNHKNIKKLNTFASNLRKNNNADTFRSSDNINTNSQSTTLDFEKYIHPRTEWQLYYTNFCRKYPLLSKTKKGKKMAKLYFQHLNANEREHYSKWKNWEIDRTEKRKRGQSVPSRHFHTRTITIHDFLWKGFM
eukprot:525958_1